MLWIVGIAHADMTIGIHHLLARKNAVGDDESLNNAVESAHASMTLTDCAGWMLEQIPVMFEHSPHAVENLYILVQ